MPTAVERVTARYILATLASAMGGSRVAGFIPDKFFNDKKAEFKRLLQETPRKAYDVAYQIEDKLIPLVKSVAKDIQQYGVHRHALSSIEQRVEMQVAKLAKIAEAYRQVAQVLAESEPYPRTTVEELVLWHVGYTIEKTFEEKVKTMKKALAEVWSITPGSPAELATKALKKATPEEKDALQRELKDDSNSWVWKVTHEFYKRAIDLSAKRLIKKTKKDTDWLGWFDLVKDILETSYSEKSVGEEHAGFDEFHVGKAKFIILAPDASGFDNSEYLRRVEQAHAVLTKKGFGKFWYGVFFITSKDFNKLSPAEQAAYKDLGYEGLESSAGTYHSSGDFIRITAPPDVKLVKTLVHEVGHRYWYKGMKSEQRARYNSLVKTNPSKKQRDFPSGPTDEDGREKEVTPVSDYGASSIEEAFAEAFTHYCLGKEMSPEQVRTFRQTLAKAETDLVAKVADRWLAASHV